MGFRSVFVIVLFFQLLGCIAQEGDVQIISTKELQEILQEKKVQLIDVRTLQEFNKGHIKGAMLLNIADELIFRTSAKKLKVDEPIYLYCQAGVRSKRAGEVLKKLGFKQIFDYSEGYSAWKKAEPNIPKRLN